MLRIFIDTSDVTQLNKYAHDSRISGCTTNPALMKQAGIASYRNFATIVLGIANGKPVSFEVIADDFDEMERQARLIASWGENLNITAVMTGAQIDALHGVLSPHHILSVFAGRIADTGRDPMHVMRKARLCKAQLLWASAREILNVYQAEECGCDIITLTPNLIDKLALQGKSLSEYSLETVRMFYRDGMGIKL